MADVTSLTITTILLVGAVLDLAGRRNPWAYLRWPWMILAIGRALGVRIVAPIRADVERANTAMLVVLFMCLGALAVRWWWHRRRSPASGADAMDVEQRPAQPSLG